MRSDEYLQILTGQIRCKMARPAVREEIQNHIEDQKAALMSEGMEEEEAELQAVREMGDSVETGQEMDRIHRPSMPWKTIGFIIALSIVGFAVQCVLRANMTGNAEYESNFAGIWDLLIGLALMGGICFADYTRIADRAREVMIVFMGGMFFARHFLGITLNGSTQWIGIGGFYTVNMAVIVMLTVPLYAAVLYRYRGQGYRAVGKGVLWMLPGVCFLFSGPSVTMTMILLFSYVIVLAAAVWKKWFRVARRAVLTAIGAASLLLPAGSLAYMYLSGTGYQKERVRVFLNMASEAEMSAGAGYLQTALRNIVGGSNLVGKSNEAADTFQMCLSSDYALTGVAVYYGILAAVLLAGIVLLLFLRFAGISLRQRNQLGMLMGTGCTAVLFLQAVLYITGNIGLTAYLFVGYCPFLVSGSTNTYVTYLLFGILLSICRYQSVAPERKGVKRLFRLSE